MKINRRDFLKGTLAFPLIYLPISTSAQESSEAYPHLRSWSRDEVRKYSRWFENIYDFKRNGTSRQKVARIHQVLKDDEMNLLNNPDFLEDGNPQCSDSALNTMNSLTHCGSFPKLMFLYYAMRRGLPSTIAKINPGRGGGWDIRYSQGNHAVDQVRSRPFNGDFRNFVLQGIGGGHGGYNFVTGNYRTAPELEGTDSVPIKISREFLKPGTVAYNANGHCLVVGKIKDSGEVHFLDSHPDRSITFNQTLSAIPFVKSADESMSRCYDGFRNHRLAKIIDGRVIPFTNEEMKDFGMSTDQYEKMREINESGSIEINGTNVRNFPSFIRARLQRGKENPFEFLEKSSSELGEMYRERAIFVKEAWENVSRNGAITFPNESSSQNIYQAHGRWETWSSPSSDVDRKNKYNYVVERLEEMVIGFPSNPHVVYEVESKDELIDELIKKKADLFSKEVISYKKSNGETVELTLLDVEQRLFDLSFNPNHAPELRWGAPEGSKEREGMKLINTPLRTGGSMPALKAYEAEQGLRYYQHRQTTPSSLNPENNPTEPPFGLLDDRLENLR